LIDEEYDNHRCSPKINGKIKVIEVDYWIKGKHPKTGEDLISTKALDGTTYWIVKRTPRPSDKVPLSFRPPTFSEQPNRNTRKGNTTRLLVVLNQWLFVSSVATWLVREKVATLNTHAYEQA
jgi:hypothetical protein